MCHARLGLLREWRRHAGLCRERLIHALRVGLLKRLLHPRLLLKRLLHPRLLLKRLLHTCHALPLHIVG